jgi:hypothetical protein
MRIKFAFNNRLLSVFLIVLLILVPYLGVCTDNNFINRDQRANTLEELEVGSGVQAYDLFGWNLTSVGNINGDQFDDIIVGAPGNDSIGEDSGIVYVFYGSRNPAPLDLDPNNAHVFITGNESGDRFGWDVASAGDVNNDGYDDIIIGSPGYNNNTGNSYIFYGGSLANSTCHDADVKLNGSMNNELFGQSVAGLGDVNGDNFDDVIVGAPGASRAYIYYGSGSMSTDIKPPTKYLATSRVIENGVEQNNYTITRQSNDTYYDVYSGDDWQYGLGDFRLRFDTGISDESEIFNVIVHLEGRVYGNLGPGMPIEISIHDFDNYDDNEDTNPKSISSNSTDQIIEWDYLTSGAFEPVTSFIDENNNGRIEVWFHRENWVSWGGTLIDHAYVIINTQPDVTLIGEGRNDRFGASVAGLGNFNGDITGYNDIVVGAPNELKGSVYIYQGSNSLPVSIPSDDANMELFGLEQGELFGWSVTGAGDINNDNFDDLVAGAPGNDHAYVYFGRTDLTPPDPKYPNLWDDDRFTTPNVVGFDDTVDPVNATLNTFGLSSPPLTTDDDGWDWERGTYGRDLKGSVEKSHHYDPEAWTEDYTYDGSNRLEVQIGPSHLLNDGSDKELMDSAAWGVQINITPSMYSTINNGGECFITLDWEAMDVSTLGGTEEPSYIKARFGNTNGYYYLGTDLGGDSEPELFYHEQNFITLPWKPIQGSSTIVVSQYITQPGYHYFDFGAKFDATNGNQGITEGVRAYFDNITMSIIPRIPHDIVINGTSGEKFGFSVGGGLKLNNDLFKDIVIGAPGSDTINGIDSGSIYSFLGKSSWNTNLDAGVDADFINYGEASYDLFGMTVAIGGSVDGDIYSEIIVGAPYNNSIISSSSIIPNSGKAYVFSPVKRPKVYLNYPTGGEIINGEITIDATATDSDNNINPIGMRFYYTVDNKNWMQIGNDPTADNGKEYSIKWDTSGLNDSYYYSIKVNVTDLDLNQGEDISKTFTIDNMYPPEVNILKPYKNEIIFGEYNINVSGRDSPKDVVGGGIDNNTGIMLYYSKDNITWKLLGNDTVPLANEFYHIKLNTTSMIDGHYWIKAEIKDIENMESEDITEFWIDNPSRSPWVYLINPRNLTKITGSIIINATAYDMDDDINSSGVSFYYSTGNDDWILIDNDPVPENNYYEILWDTTTVNDGYYWVKAFVNDTTNFTASNISGSFLIHNNDENPPIVKVTNPNNYNELKLNVLLEADVFDIDGNLENEGVKFYYSSDKNSWIYIGNQQTPDTSDENHYIYIWNTINVPDGKYWLNATANDTTGLTGWDLSDEPFFIHNNLLTPPMVDIIYPNGGEVLEGEATIVAAAGDIEENIDGSGVKFYFSMDRNNWTMIDYMPFPSSSTPIEPYMFPYSLDWDTTKVDDGFYWLKATVTDTDDLISEDISEGQFLIHNRDQNVPIVKIIYPNGGEELKDTISLQTSGFDLDSDIDEVGVKFYYSSDNRKTWQLIGNDSTGNRIETNLFFELYELYWDTTTVQDGIYWLKVEASDLTGLTGTDISDGSFIIHNTNLNTPMVRIISPIENDTVNSTIKIQVEVIDLENDVKIVQFYYSPDNKSWTLIDTETVPTDLINNIYSINWNTQELYDDMYWIKVVAVDNELLEGTGYSGRFFVNNGNVEIKDQDSEDDLAGLWWLWIILIVIIIIICLIGIILQRKRKAKKLEKAITGLAPQVIPQKPGPSPAVGVIQPQFVAGPAPQQVIRPELTTTSPQPMLPSAVTTEDDGGRVDDHQTQLAIWKNQGYNIRRLEVLKNTDMNQFWKAFPFFKTNIEKLQQLKSRFNVLDTTGFEVEARSIQMKLTDPDQTIIVENEVLALENKIEQKKRSEPVISELAAVPSEEKATAKFDEFLPKEHEIQDGEEVEPEIEQVPKEEIAAENEMEEDLNEAGNETSSEEEEEFEEGSSEENEE